MRSKARQAAFSVIELLVVVAVVALLLSLVLPSLAAARESARSTVCQSNLRQIHGGFESYRFSVNDGVIPVSPGLGSREDDLWVLTFEALSVHMDLDQTDRADGERRPLWTCPSHLKFDLTDGYSYDYRLGNYTKGERGLIRPWYALAVTRQLDATVTPRIVFAEFSQASHVVSRDRARQHRVRWDGSIESVEVPRLVGYPY
ncbi:MAG: prepilin-type N-terminal cleavage/methylation domain-containing protein [Planctomycetota bacterium]